MSLISVSVHGGRTSYDTSPTSEHLPSQHRLMHKHRYLFYQFSKFIDQKHQIYTAITPNFSDRTTFITLSYHQNMIHHRSGNIFHFGGDKNSFSGEIQKFVDVFSHWDNTKITPRYHPNVIFPRPHLHRNNT